jgi:hypothetical protein
LTILLLSRTLTTISSTNLGVRFYGVSSLDQSLHDITLSHIYIFWPMSKVFPFANPSW